MNWMDTPTIFRPIAQTLRQRLAKDLAYPQFRAVVLGGFAALALLLAAVGL